MKKKSTQEGADEYSKNPNNTRQVLSLCAGFFCVCVCARFNVCLHNFQIEEISFVKEKKKKKKIQTNVMCNKYLLLELFVVSMRSSLANKGKKIKLFSCLYSKDVFC